MSWELVAHKFLRFLSKCCKSSAVSECQVVLRAPASRLYGSLPKGQAAFRQEAVLFALHNTELQKFGAVVAGHLKLAFSLYATVLARYFHEKYLFGGRWPVLNAFCQSVVRVEATAQAPCFRGLQNNSRVAIASRLWL